MLWFGSGPEVAALRLTSFLSIFDCHEFSALYGTIDDSMLAALCLVTYIALQVASPSSGPFKHFLVFWEGNYNTKERERKEEMGG